MNETPLPCAAMQANKCLAACTPRQSRLRGLPGAEWAGSEGDFGTREGRVNGRPSSVTRDHWPAALQNQRQHSLRVDALDQDAVLEGDGAGHACLAAGSMVRKASAQVAKPGVPVVTTHPGGVWVRMTYCLCFT